MGCSLCFIAKINIDISPDAPRLDASAPTSPPPRRQPLTFPNSLFFTYKCARQDPFAIDSNNFPDPPIQLALGPKILPRVARAPKIICNQN